MVTYNYRILDFLVLIAVPAMSCPGMDRLSRTSGTSGELEGLALTAQEKTSMGVGGPTEVLT